MVSEKENHPPEKLRLREKLLHRASNILFGDEQPFHLLLGNILFCFSFKPNKQFRSFLMLATKVKDGYEIAFQKIESEDKLDSDDLFIEIIEWNKNGSGSLDETRKIYFIFIFFSFCL